MSDNLCKDGFEHRIGQDYDERRGAGNGPQKCLKCGVSLNGLLAQARKGYPKDPCPFCGRDLVAPKLYTQSELNQAVEEAEIRGRIIEVKRLLTVYSHKPSLFDLVHNETDSAMLANERLIKDLTEREQELKLKVSLRGSAAQLPLNTKDKQA